MANKASKVVKSPKYPASIAGDIPEAVRDQIPTDSPGWWKLVLIACAGLGFGGLLMIGTIIVANLQPPVATSNAATPESPGSPAAIDGNSPPRSTSINPANTNSPNTPNQVPRTGDTPDNLLGHFPYTEAPAGELQALASEPKIQLRRPAAESFEAMVQAAKAQGVNLVALSGFRSISDQKYLFFDIKAERGQVATKRAEVSAPPGYSEHHTGYAIDVGDGKVPATNLSQDFEKTDAFQWLQQNAARYSFEISFTPGNPQGVSYEPWHWRFVGDIKSLETFYKTRQNLGGRSINNSGNSSPNPSPSSPKTTP